MTDKKIESATRYPRRRGIQAMTTTKMPEVGCPVCMKKLNSAIGVDHKNKPKPGDCSLCIYCSSFLIINSDFTLREMTEVEIGELDDESRQKLIHSRKAIEQINE